MHNHGHPHVAPSTLPQLIVRHAVTVESDYNYISTGAGSRQINYIVIDITLKRHGLALPFYTCSRVVSEALDQFEGHHG